MKSHRESNCHLSRDGALDALHECQRHVYAGIRDLLILMENPENADCYKFSIMPQWGPMPILFQVPLPHGGVRHGARRCRMRIPKIVTLF
jgi:hypothetical protein